jgi:hypothetical protein
VPSVYIYVRLSINLIGATSPGELSFHVNKHPKPSLK